MAKYSIEDSTLTNIANAIRAKTGGTAALKPTAMDEALNGIPTQAATTVTPSTADQTAVAKGVFTTGAVTVKGDANLKAENIAEDVSIFGVVGSHAGGKSTVRVTLVATNGRIDYLDANGNLQTVRFTTEVVDVYFGAVFFYAQNGGGITGDYVLMQNSSGYCTVICLSDGCVVTSGSDGAGD